MTSKCEIDERGNKKWYNEKGELHNEDGPAIECTDGYIFWYINGKCHRIDGPARIIPNGSTDWCINDQFHRIDGPARIWPDGYKRWYINGKRYSFNQWLEQLVEQGYKTKDEILTMKLLDDDSYYDESFGRI